MIINRYYVTHGYHIIFYLYDENSDKPWARLHWCGMAPNGFENIFLFLPYCKS